jgi:hypothetical protein
MQAAIGYLRVAAHLSQKSRTHWGLASGVSSHCVECALNLEFARFWWAGTAQRRFMEFS